MKNFSGIDTFIVLDCCLKQKHHGHCSSELLPNISVELRAIIKVYYAMPMSNGVINRAVHIWVGNQTQAMLKFGLISSWNTSDVTCMGGLFQDCQLFNEDISMWDVSNVTDMSEMFSMACSFNQPLNT